MKTALLISGLPRCVDRGVGDIQNCLMAPNSPDVFIHTWGNPNDQVLRDKLTNYFHPKMLVIEPPKIIHNTHIDIDRMIRKHAPGYGAFKFIEMTYSMWWSILQANLLKETNRLEHNIQYDWVIRARFDITYTKPVDCKSYNPDVLNIADRPGLPPEMVDDRFAFASNTLMNLYCGWFNQIEWIWAKRDKMDGIICGETIVYEMCKLFNITPSITPGLAANHLR